MSDKLNEEVYPNWKYKLKMIFSLLITFTIICCVIATVVGIFLLKKYVKIKPINFKIFDHCIG